MRGRLLRACVALCVAVLPRLAAAQATPATAVREDDRTADAPPTDSTEPQPDVAESPAEEPLLDLDAIDTSEAEPFQFHGRLDLTYAHYEGENRVDEFDRNDVLPLSPGVFLSYEFLEDVAAVLELEWDGLEESIEIDRAMVHAELFGDHVDLAAGRDIIPFGVERFYYAPSRNVFVDRPATFRAVYPGTFADYGIFASARHESPQGWSAEGNAAVTLGLQDEFDREGVENLPVENNDSLQFTGRLSLSPVERFVCGASYLVSNYDDDDDLQYDFLGVDGRYTLQDFNLRAEWVGGRVERLAADGGSFYRHGWYVQLDRRWEIPFRYPRAFQTGFRFDDIDPNTQSRDGLDLRRYSAVVVCEILENLRWKFQYTVQDEKRQEEWNDGFLSQIEYHW